jgi:hypothetical protein
MSPESGWDQGGIQGRDNSREYVVRWRFHIKVWSVLWATRRLSHSPIAVARIGGCVDQLECHRHPAETLLRGQDITRLW